MGSTPVNYRVEERKSPKGGLPLVDVYVSQGEEVIPLKKDWSNRRCTMVSTFPGYIERMLNFKCRPDDVWVVTMPKCGTTWMQETAWLIYNDFDFKTAKSVALRKRSPFVEYSAIRAEFPGQENTFDYADSLKSPRLLKSHGSANLLPTDIWKLKNKIIYVTRDVKDTVVSFYHFANYAIGAFRGSKEDFVEAFINENLFYTPYWQHALEFYHMRNEPNIFFTSYERMKIDLEGVITDLCTFLGKPIPNEEILKRAVEHLSFDNMKKSAAGEALQNGIDKIKENLDIKSDFQFLRRGVVGSYKDELPEELVRKLDEWSTKILKEANLTNDQLLGFTQ